MQGFNNRYFELIVPARCGRGTVTEANGAAHRLDGGEITVIPPFCSRSEINCGKGDIHVLIERALLPVKEVITVNDVENEGIRHAAVQAVKYYTSDCDRKDIVLTALGNLLVSYIIFTLGEGAKFSPIVEIVRADIEGNISNTTYSLEDGLKKMPLNYDYIRKLFKKETGLTPHEYLISRRMELALTLLTSGFSNRYSNYSVSQVAEACGFAEPLYFSRVFKKYYKKSPSDYLKNRKQ